MKKIDLLHGPQGVCLIFAVDKCNCFKCNCCTSNRNQNVAKKTASGRVKNFKMRINLPSFFEKLEKVNRKRRLHFNLVPSSFTFNSARYKYEYEYEHSLLLCSVWALENKLINCVATTNVAMTMM
ncbi:hypothetical protein ACLKA6_006430 [Drosophila palustris]